MIDGKFTKAVCIFYPCFCVCVFKGGELDTITQPRLGQSCSRKIWQPHRPELKKIN